MHNAVAEVWFSSLLNELDNVANKPTWLVEFCSQVKSSLDANWIDGITSSFCNFYLTDTERLKVFIQLAGVVQSKIFHELQDKNILKRDGFQASSILLHQELAMLMALLSSPEKVPAIACIYSLQKKEWLPA